MNQPLVSFIVPFYGSTGLLKQGLDSLVSQTDGDFEAVVVDDRSPERAAELLSEYDSRFRYVLQPENRGSYQARLRAMQEACGEYIVDMDCDDYVAKDLVATIRAAVQDRPADIFAFNLKRDVDGIISDHWCQIVDETFTGREALKRFAENRLQWSVFARAFRRELAVRAWQVEPALCDLRVLAPDDYAAIVPVVLLSQSMRALSYCGYYYRDTANSICHNASFSKVRRTIVETLRVQRVLSSFVRRLGMGSEVESQVRAVAMRIIKWWVAEYKVTLKQRLRVLLSLHWNS